MNSSSFEPIVGGDARVLILGTLPSQASLAAGEYYAHPRNAFWPIMGRLLDFPRELAYTERKKRLVRNRLAVWDVCARAFRPGSLDAAIDDVEPNDFASFFAKHRRLELIGFNGGTAEQLYRRHVLANLPMKWQSFPTVRLPSTSPAHAGMSFDKKLAAWKSLLVIGVAAK